MGSARKAWENERWGEGQIAPGTIELVRRFGTEEQCEEYLIGLRWRDGFSCPVCGCTEYKKIGGRREYRCRNSRCNWQFSATSGTMLAHTKVPLTSWFLAAFLLVSDSRGVSAQRVARECAVSDTTAGRMLERLRAAMGFAMSLCKVGGDFVEVDGGHVACGNPGTEVTRPGSGKTDAPVLVAVSATSCAIRATSDSTQGTLEEFASAHVSRNHEVRCDGHGANLALAGGWDVVARKSAADGDSEASLPVAHHVLSNLKAMLIGTYHGVSVKRLQSYCDQFAWRYSHRLGDAFADLLGELARWPHVKQARIMRCHPTMPKHPSADEPGKEHNKRLRRRHRSEIEAWEREVEEREAQRRDAAQALAHVLSLASGLRRAEEEAAREARDREWEERDREVREWNREHASLRQEEELRDLVRQAFRYGW